MIDSIHDAKAALEAEGLLVSQSKLPGLLIASSFVVSSFADGLDELRVFQDACGLNQRNGEWIVVFPAEGLLQYHIPGTLADGVALILAAYRDHRQNGGMFKDACKRVLKDTEQYLVGRSDVGV